LISFFSSNYYEDLYSLTILISLISLTTLAILPAFVPILAPLLALARAAASSYSYVSN